MLILLFMHNIGHLHPLIPLLSLKPLENLSLIVALIDPLFLDMLLAKQGARLVLFHSTTFYLH